MTEVQSITSKEEFTCPLRCPARLRTRAVIVLALYQHHLSFLAEIKLLPIC